MKTRILTGLILASFMAGCSTTPSTEVTDVPVVTAPTESAPVAATPAAEIAAAPVSDRAALTAAIQAKLDDPRFAGAQWGCLVQSLNTNEVWIEQNGNKLFMPASNEKIPTCAAALLELGADYTYKTTVSHTGSLADGVLQGDLIVTGTGDPTFYTKWTETQDSRVWFRQWAATLKEKGITRITGSVIGDDNAWDDSHIGDGWPYDGLWNWYYAEYSALQFNENYVDIMVHPPATADGQVMLVPNVKSNYYTLINNIKVVPDGSNSVSLYRPHFSNEITLSGRVAVGGNPFEVTPTITNPTLFFATVLTEVLREEGIAVDGMPMDCDAVPGWDGRSSGKVELFVHESPKLIEIMKQLFKRSQNMYSETMAYTMGMNRGGVATFRSGRRVVEERLAELGVTGDEFVYSDGSGLSRYNYISPRAIAKIYTAMWNSPLKDAWWDIQSIAGEDGTLRSRMKGTAAASNVRGKTGTIGNVRALSGYVKTAAGEPLFFSLLVNGHTRSGNETNDITDSIAVLLAEYTGN